MRILICDDNRDAADTLAAFFSESEHEVAVCYDGPSCIEKARAWQPFVAILDLGMPAMTGYEVAAAIRAMDFGKRVLMIAVTGYATAEDRERSAASGFDLHFSKPADPMMLFRLVSNLTRH